MQIWKFEISVEDKPTVMIPKGAKILSVGIQEENYIGYQPIMLWALVDPESEPCPRRFMIYGTGHEVNHDLIQHQDFIGTVQQGPLVWHIFDGGY